MSLSQNIHAIRQANASIRSQSLNTMEQISWYRLYVYWFLYPFRYNKSSNNHILLSSFFALLIASLTASRSRTLQTENLDFFIGLQCLNAVIGSITLFDVNQYVALWQIRMLPLHATLPWSNHRLLTDYLRGVIKRGLVFFLTGIFMSIGYCVCNPTMHASRQWAPCILATIATIVLMLAVSCLLTSIGNPTIRYRVWRWLAWLRWAAIALAVGTIPAMFIPMLHVSGWPEFLLLFRFLPPAWPFAILLSLLENGENYGVVILSVALLGAIAFLGHIAWQRLPARIRIVDFFGQDNRSLFGILPSSLTSDESYIRELEEMELAVLESSNTGLEPLINREIDKSNRSVELQSYETLPLSRYRDRFWAANGRLRPFFERILTENERTVVAIAYSHKSLPKLREIVWSLTFIALCCLVLQIASETYFSWLPVRNLSRILKWSCFLFVFIFAARWVSSMNLHVYRFMPLDASTIVVAIWKFTVVYWLIGIGTVCPFVILYFLYIGWHVLHALAAITIVLIVVPCVAMSVQLANLFIGTKQSVRALDFLSCLVLDVILLVLAVAIVVLMILVNNALGRVASSLFFLPWTYALYRWAIYRYNHRTLDVGSPWPGH